MATRRNNDLTRSQVAELFGVSPHTVSRWAREGRLPSVATLGGQRRYPQALVAKLLAAQQAAARLD